MASIVSDNPTNTNQNTVLGTAHKRLFYLHDLPDYKVHHDDADVRTWSVRLETGEVIGKVENLVVDKTTEKVRYLETTADRGFFSKHRENTSYLDHDADKNWDADTDEHFIIPIGMSKLDRAAHTVYVVGATPASIGSVPRYRRGSMLRPRYEISSLDYYDKNYRNDKDTPFNREAYRDFDDNMFQGMGDKFYESRMFNSDSYYDRNTEARTSKGL